MILAGLQIMNKIIERIEREAGVPGLVSILAERLAPTDLQSLLLEVYRLRSSRRSASEVLADYESDRFVRPSTLPPARLLTWEQSALAALPAEFLPLALSPVCPLGTCSVTAGVDQNWAVATSRNSEVVSDSTNVLALECALRRRQLLRTNPKSSEPVHLAASHRLLRGQHFHNPLNVPHFNIFSLCSAGRDIGSMRFELTTLGLHIRFYLKALRAFLGTEVPLQLSLTDFNARQRHSLLEDELLKPIGSEFEHLDCTFDDRRSSGKGYYHDLCFHIHATSPSSGRLELADGGVVDWTQRLLSNAKERLVISGIGSERLCSEF
jgi:hypothetical protein